MTVTPGVAAIAAGETLTAKPTIKMDGTSTKDYALTWSSSDTSVATVDESGVITAVGAGETVIMAKLSAVNGRALAKVINVKINLQVSAS